MPLRSTVKSKLRRKRETKGKKKDAFGVWDRFQAVENGQKMRYVCPYANIVERGVEEERKEGIWESVRGQVAATLRARGTDQNQQYRVDFVVWSTPSIEILFW